MNAIKEYHKTRILRNAEKQLMKPGTRMMTINGLNIRVVIIGIFLNAWRKLWPKFVI
jgi:hypothetical protein